MSWRAFVLVLALVVAGCTGVDGTSSPSTTLVDGGYDLIEPEPDETPIEVDPRVRIGRLDNGLTYYLRSNGHPGLGLSLRLAVNAGSLQQRGPESGAAHFLEHMLFNGTERFPGNELDRALQRIGVEIGPDLNAYTSFDETVYQLELAGIDDETIDVGFSVLAEWASAATIDERATVEERGVVREEIRLSGEGSAGAIGAVFDEAYFDGTAYESREPGGSDELVLATTADQLRSFYERWYRPDLMAVIAVGDLPLDRLEEEVRSRFSDLEAGSDRPPRTEPAVEPTGVPFVRAVDHPELSATFGSIDYPITRWDDGTVGGERHSIMQELYALMIQNRLHTAVDLGRVDLDDPWAGIFQENRSQRFLGFSYDADDLDGSSRFVLSEVRRAELAGFTEAEYERAAAELRADLDQYRATAPTVNDREYADDYAAHFLSGAQIQAANEVHERLTAVLEELDVDDVTELFRWELSRTAPILIVAGPDPQALPTDEELRETIEVAAKPRPVTDGSVVDVAIAELMARPDPVAPATTAELAEVDGTSWEFDNGVSVRFISSSIATNQVELEAVSEGGWSVLDTDAARLAPVAAEAVSLSGLGPHDRLTVRRFLAGSNTFLAPYVDETVEGFVGFSGSDDLEVLFQRLHLSVVEPRVDGPALRQAVDSGEELGRLAATDPAVATRAALADLLYGGSELFSVAPPPLDALTEEQALDIYRSRFATVDDLTVAVVGDVDPDVVADLAARYLGTLPAGPPDSWEDVRPESLDDVARAEVVVGSGEIAGVAAVLYPTEAPVGPTTRVELLLLENILTTRLFEEVREELGASYGGFVELAVRDAPTDGVEALLYADVDPRRVEEILDVLVTEASEIASEGPSEDEFERARTVLRSDFDLISNFQLLDMLLTEADEDVLTFDRRAEILDGVERDDLRSLAASIFPADVRAEVIALPG